MTNGYDANRMPSQPPALSPPPTPQATIGDELRVLLDDAERRRSIFCDQIRGVITEACREFEQSHGIRITDVQCHWHVDATDQSGTDYGHYNVDCSTEVPR